MTPTDLRTLLDSNRVTPKQLAQRLDCTPATVRNLLAGRVKLTRIHALAIRAVMVEEELPW